MVRAGFFVLSIVVLATLVSLSVLMGPAVGTAQAQDAPALPEPGEQVKATGFLSPVFPASPYSHVLNDETTSESFLARSSVVDLYSFDDGQKVTVRGTLLNDPLSSQPILEVTGIELASEPEPVTATFELTVGSQPPPQTTFFGVASELGFGTGSTSAQLTDPDGDRVYTGSAQVPQGRQRSVFIEQGTGAKENPFGFRSPGEPRSMIKDFGLVTFDGDKTFSTTVSFGQTPPANSEKPTSLPNTSRPPLVLPVLLSTAGVLLIGGGILASRVWL